jgi:hypothetical protein
MPVIRRLAWMKKTLVAYRPAIGQPRKEELIIHLMNHLDPEDVNEFASRASIDWSPTIVSMILP